MTPGRWYEAYTFDAFRVKNGKLVEHWDTAVINLASACSRQLNVTLRSGIRDSAIRRFGMSNAQNAQPPNPTAYFFVSFFM